MKNWREPVLAAALIALGVAAWMVLAVGLVWLALAPDARTGLLAGISAQLPMVLAGWALAVVAIVVGWRRSVVRPRSGLAQLGEQARVLLYAEVGTLALATEDDALGRLAATVRALAVQRDTLQRDVQAQIAQGSQRVQQEKDRLAALLAELPQSVLVCNLDGRILLYNQQARRLLGRAAAIGRSLDGLMDPSLLQHALRGVRRRLERGEASATHQFVTYTPDGQLLQAQMAPVLAGAADAQEQEDGAAAATAEITGYLLLLDDITHKFAHESRREQVLTELTEGSRASLASIRAAVEMLDYDDVDADMRKRFLAVVHEETQRMATRVDEVASHAAAEVRTRWPLQDMLGSDFIAMAQHHLRERTNWEVAVAGVPAELWLRVDSYSLVQALAYLAWHLLDQFEIAALQLRLQAADGERAHLDLLWQGGAVSTETAMAWETEPMQTGSEHSPLTVRDVVARHDGEIWLERDRTAGSAFFRFLLPLGAAHAAPATGAAADAASRPEFYDFDLFQRLGSDAELDQQPLAGLRYTVFDTETTGLDPDGGDQIIQIGAVRIVNARVLAGDVFDQLVNPGRDIPDAGFAIHGISRDRVAGQPRITQVLPEFHRFAEDSVLVAHNAAFDMKFLQLQQQRAGVVFEQPVLDTLLLSAVVHPAQERHSLEDIAARLGLAISDRHNALGDARLTAEIWLRLMAQLADLGINTLGQALEAAQRTYYARLKY